ncbi:MAG TPA: hypothetical protein VGF17_07995, partial [Phytomonospora sp.]
MRHEEVRGLFARTLNTPPVPATGTDAIVAEGRKLERRRRTAAYGGSTLAAVVAVAVGVALLQPGGGSGPGIDGAEGPAANWNTSGEPDPKGDYADALALIVGEGLPGVNVDTVNDTAFLFAWNEDRTAIVSTDHLEIEGEDSLVLDVTIQEPKPGTDVEARLQELAGCAGDCALSEFGNGRRLLTKEDQVQPDTFGPRSRLWALVSRPDGTVATGALWVEDDTPGTIAMPLEQLTEIVAALPDTTTAPVGGPSPEDSETNPANIAAMLDEALAEEVERQFPDSDLTDYTGYEGFDELGFRYGETIDGWRSDGLILVATPPNMSVLAEV